MTTLPCCQIGHICLHDQTFIKNWVCNNSTCGPFHERWWRRQVALNPHWCCNCGVVDTAQTDETDQGSHRAGSFQHRCLSWVEGTQANYVCTRHIFTIRGLASLHIIYPCLLSYLSILKLLTYTCMLCVCVPLAWWPTQRGHDELGVCRSVDWGFSAKHKNWPKWCLHCEQSSTLSATKSSIISAN